MRVALTGIMAAKGVANLRDKVVGVYEKAGFPHFKSRRRTAPAFKLRSKSRPGQTAPVRVAGRQVRAGGLLPSTCRIASYSRRGRSITRSLPFYRTAATASASTRSSKP